jgi:hypothetical protein
MDKQVLIFSLSNGQELVGVKGTTDEHGNCNIINPVTIMVTNQNGQPAIRLMGPSAFGEQKVDSLSIHKSKIMYTLPLTKNLVEGYNQYFSEIVQVEKPQLII